MKNVILALFVLFAAQPVQASFCTMELNMGGMNMGNMNSAMDHVMQHAADAPVPDVDCCEHEDTDTSRSCDSTAFCGATPASAAVLEAGLKSGTVLMVRRLPLFKNSPLTPSFDSPPYRPPIS